MKNQKESSTTLNYAATEGVILLGAHEKLMGGKIVTKPMDVQTAAGGNTQESVQVDVAVREERAQPLQHVTFEVQNQVHLFTRQRRIEVLMRCMYSSSSVPGCEL